MQIKLQDLYLWVTHFVLVSSPTAWRPLSSSTADTAAFLWPASHISTAQSMSLIYILLKLKLNGNTNEVRKKKSFIKYLFLAKHFKISLLDHTIIYIPKKYLFLIIVSKCELY